MTVSPGTEREYPPTLAVLLFALGIAICLVIALLPMLHGFRSSFTNFPFELLTRLRG